MALPRMDAYLAALPSGLDSHPQARQKASVYRGVVDELDLLGLVPQLPPRNLMVPLAIRVYGAAFRAALEGVGARAVRMELVEHGPEEAVLEARWS